MDAKKTVEMSNLLSEVAAERQRQTEKWGEQNHSTYKYLAILGEEVGEANKAVLDHEDKPEGNPLENLRMELIQVAAVAVAMIECGDRNNWWK